MKVRLLPAVVVVMALGVVLLVVAAGASAEADQVASFHTDVEYFRRSAAAVLEGRTPYVDFDLQYPPLVLVPALLPYVLSGLDRDLNPGDYYLLFSCVQLAVMATVGVLTLVLAYRTVPTRALSSAAVFAAMTGGLVVVLPWRYDAVPVLLGGVALLLLTSQRHLLTGVAAAAGVATKVYPVLWVPFLVIASWRQSVRAAAATTVGGLVTGLVVLLPFAAVDVTAPLRMFGEQVARGIQVESLWGSLALAAGTVGFIPSATEHRIDGAWEVVSPVASVLGAIQPLVFATAALGLVAVGWRALGVERSTAGTSLTITALLGAVTATFLITNKVLSPQHVYWLLPFVAVASRRVQLVASATAVLTGVIYPFMYRGLLDASLAPVVLLLIRNGLIAWVAVELAHTALRAQTEPLPLRREAGPSDGPGDENDLTDRRQPDDEATASPDGTHRPSLACGSAMNTTAMMTSP